jgi:hypothetical protein
VVPLIWRWFTHTIVQRPENRGDLTLDIRKGLFSNQRARDIRAFNAVEVAPVSRLCWALGPVRSPFEVRDSQATWCALDSGAVLVMGRANLTQSLSSFGSAQERTNGRRNPRNAALTAA